MSRIGRRTHALRPIRIRVNFSGEQRADTESRGQRAESRIQAAKSRRDRKVNPLSSRYDLFTLAKCSKSSVPHNIKSAHSQRHKSPSSHIHDHGCASISHVRRRSHTTPPRPPTTPISLHNLHVSLTRCTGLNDMHTLLHRLRHDPRNQSKETALSLQCLPAHELTTRRHGT
jgi:hypothetical protein